MNAKAKGYILGSIAAASYGMNPLFALPLYKAGMDPDSVLFFRYLFAIPLLGIMIKARGRSFKIQRKETFPLIIMGLLVALSSLTLFLSYNYMAAGIASTLLFVYPIMVALIMAMVFKEKLALQTIVCMLLALGGIGLLYKSEDGSTLSLIGTLLVFASSLSYAIYIVGINQTSLKNVATLKVTFYVLLFGLSLFVARLLYSGVLNTPDQWYLWANLLALAVFPTAISFLCTTGAIQYIGSTPTAILGALEPVTAIFFGIAVFGESLTVRESFGLVMIIVAVTFVIAGGNITSQLVRFRKLFPRLPIRSKKETNPIKPSSTMKKSLYLLLLLLFPIGLQAQSEVIVLRPDEGKAEVNEAEYTRIFLAGTIDMGKSIDWQKATCDWFRARPQGKYILYNPRRDKGLSGEMSDFEHQVNWELEHLEKANLIIMNILASSKSPITLLEMGLHMRSGKLHVICEPGFYRYDNVRITCNRYGVPLYHSMDEFLKTVR